MSELKCHRRPHTMAAGIACRFTADSGFYLIPLSPAGLHMANVLGVLTACPRTWGMRRFPLQRERARLSSTDGGPQHLHSESGLGLTLSVTHRGPRAAPACVAVCSSIVQWVLFH